MRVAAIYDIHGNLPALEAVLHDLDQASVDSIVVGGDVIPGPMPSETIACLRALEIPVRFIHGNGEREVLALKAGQETTVPDRVREALQWVAEQLDSKDVRWLASWHDTVRFEISGLGEVLFCHAIPRSDSEIFTRLTPEDRLLRLFEEANAPLVICGHTHMPFDRTIGNTRVVNAGSVGMPFGEPGADWLILGPDIELRHTPYDLSKAAQRIRETQYPDAHEFAANNVLQPPTEEAMLELLRKAEV